ncbi:hypothetical protein IFM89_001950 [Coptis chinensis]|uniref:Angio-associated migratory cell protein n=1 Tax=Coptis chinensis TaxID=261450 RepID=A0A835ITL1_9MAGN|nr:hypothetical protein IFM89_001950 [Coptis chinensis]
MSEERDMNNNELREVFFDEEDILSKIVLPSSNDDVDHDDDGDHFSEDADNPDDSFHLFNGHKDPILTVACSPTSEDDMAFLWSIGQGNQSHELLGHSNSITSLAFSADGKLLASGSFDGLVQVWDAYSGSHKCTLAGPSDGVEWVRWHPRGNLVLASSEDSTVSLWNADKATHLNIFFGHEGSVTCGDFTPDGYPYHTEAITCLTISYDSNLAITRSEDSSVHMVHIATGKGQITQSHSGDLGQVPQVISSLLTHSGSVMCVGLSPSVPLLATGSLDENLIIWDMQNFVARFTCVHEVGVSCLAWLGKSQYIATGCVDGKVLVWDSISGNCGKIFNGHLHNIASLSVSSNGEFLVSGSMDGNVRVFEIAEFH